MHRGLQRIDLLSKLNNPLPSSHTRRGRLTTESIEIAILDIFFYTFPFVSL